MTEGQITEPGSRSKTNRQPSKVLRIRGHFNNEFTLYGIIWANLYFRIIKARTVCLLSFDISVLRRN